MAHRDGPPPGNDPDQRRRLRRPSGRSVPHDRLTLRSEDVTFRPMTEPDARQIATWRYPAPYDFYDLPDDAWPDLLGLGDRFLAADLPEAITGDLRTTRWRVRRPRLPRRDRPAVAPELAAGVWLGGFVCFGHEAQVSGARNAGLYRDPALDIGLGLRPDLTGRGLGGPFFTACLDLAVRREPSLPIRLAVATFNERAIATYRRAGFVEAGTCRSPVRGREVAFLVMTRPPDHPSP